MDLIEGKLLKGQTSMCEAEEDRISLLPDPLIHHILSSLDIKSVVRTSLLSKRWSHIWTSIPILNFRFSGFYVFPDTITFTDFVDRTLHLHDFSNINKFSLSWLWRSDQLNVPKINSWISAVMRHNVEEISLSLYQEVQVPVSLPLSLFTCRSLVTLELSTNLKICLPKYICFPRLKRLIMRNFEFSDDCWNEQLFSNCPMLQDLNLDQCTYPRNFNISIPSLKLLKFEHPGEEEGYLQDCSLKIHLPSLESLYCLGRVPKEFILSTFPTLVEAEVGLSVDHYAFAPPTREQRIVHAVALNRFFRALTHVKRLSVYEDTLQDLSFADDQFKNLPTLHNLKHLTICSEVNIDEPFIALLKATPNLESLVFNRLITPFWVEECYSRDNDVARDDDGMCSFEGEDNHGNEDDVSVIIEGKRNSATKDYGLEFDMVSTGCLFLHLKSICFKQFIGRPREMRWVNLFLKNAKYLQTVSISYGTDTNCSFYKPKSKEEVMVEIPSLPRASSSCVFKFFNFGKEENWTLPHCWSEGEWGF